MLKILIIDDDPKRFSFFDNAIIGKFAQNSDIEIATNARDALQKLEKLAYDVLIVDMAIPTTPWAKEANKNGGVEVLQHLLEDDDLIRPHYVIGLTASVDDDPEITNFFIDSPWVLMKIGGSGGDWQSKLVSFIEHADTVKNAEESLEYGVDVCIVTALSDPEQSAVLATDVSWEDDPEYLDSNTVIKRGVLATSGGQQLTVISGCSMRMGSVEAALLTSKIINRYRPKILAMAGICAGMEGKVAYGDAILGSPVWDWTSSKWDKDENGNDRVLPSPHYLECSREVISRFRTLGQDVGYLAQIRHKWQGPKPKDALSAVVGPSASGPIVVADGTTLQNIKVTQNRDVVGLEMEAYGVYAAAISAGLPRPVVLSIKSVCDFADPRKNDEMQRYASYTSAQITVEFVKRYARELASMLCK